MEDFDDYLDGLEADSNTTEEVSDLDEVLDFDEGFSEPEEVDESSDNSDSAEVNEDTFENVFGTADEQDEDEDEEETPPEEPKEESRGSKRFQKLANEKRALEEENARIRASTEQMQYHFQQQFQALQHQLAQQSRVQQEYLDTQRRLQEQQRQEAEEAELSPLERLRRDIQRESEAKARATVEQELAGFRQALDRQRQEFQAKQEERAKAERYQKYQNLTTQSVSAYIPSESVSPEERTLLESFYLSTALSMGKEPGDPALEANYAQALNTIFNLGLKVRKTKAAANKAPKPKKLPSAALNTQAGTKQATPTTDEEARKMGYSSLMDWATS